MKKILLVFIIISTSGFSQFNKLYEKYEGDKILHYVVGGFVSSNTYFACYKLSDRVGLSIGAGITAAFLAGEGKELYDRSIGKKFSNDDLAFTAFGGGHGIFAIAVVIGTHERIKYKIED